MSHDKLLREGKITRREYNDLVGFKQSDPRFYKFLEKQYSKRAKGEAPFRERRFEALQGHVQRAEEE